MLSWKGKGKELKVGNWNRIEIYAGEKVNTAPLIEKFEKDLADFKKPVRFLNGVLVNYTYWFFAFRFKTARTNGKPRRTG